MGLPNRLVNAAEQRGIPVDQVELKTQERPSTHLTHDSEKQQCLSSSQNPRGIKRRRGSRPVRSRWPPHERLSVSPSCLCSAQWDSRMISHWLSIFLYIPGAKHYSSLGGWRQGCVWLRGGVLVSFTPCTNRTGGGGIWIRTCTTVQHFQEPILKSRSQQSIFRLADDLNRLTLLLLDGGGELFWKL